MANRKIKIGDTVTTSKQDKRDKLAKRKKPQGKVYGFTKWGRFPAVNIKLKDGSARTILLQNIVFIK